METLIVGGVALIVGTFLVGILVNNNGFFYKQTSTVSEGLGLNDTVREIENSIRQAASVSSGYPEVSPIYTYTSGASTLVLKLPSYNESGVIANVYDYIVIAPDALKPKILRMQIFKDDLSQREEANKVLTTLVESVQFSYLDKNGNSVSPVSASSVGVTLKLLAKTGSVGSSRSSSTVINLRNN